MGECGKVKENLGEWSEIKTFFFFWLFVSPTTYIQIDLLEEKDAHRSINQSINQSSCDRDVVTLHLKEFITDDILGAGWTINLPLVRFSRCGWFDTMTLQVYY